MTPKNFWAGVGFSWDCFRGLSFFLFISSLVGRNEPKNAANRGRLRVFASGILFRPPFGFPPAGGQPLWFRGSLASFLWCHRRTEKRAKETPRQFRPPQRARSLRGSSAPPLKRWTKLSTGGSREAIVFFTKNRSRRDVGSDGFFPQRKNMQFSKTMGEPP